MKRNNKTRRIILPILIIVFILGQIDNSAKNATVAQDADANVIIVNGIVLGASKSSSWISAEKFYEANINEAELEVDVFSTNAQ